MGVALRYPSLCRSIHNQQKNKMWKSTKEELPPVSEFVLCCDARFTYPCYFTGYIGIYGDWIDSAGKEIHPPEIWMPIPAPSKGILR
jgi:hypothetical protein